MSSKTRQKWDELAPPVRAGVVVVAIGVAVLFVIKVLPALIAALGIGALLAILVIPYWIPTIIAFVRKHPSKGAVLAVNFFLGWTFIGWVLALVWALSDNTGRGASVVVNTTVSPSFVVASMGTASPPQYQIGDVVNGHRFDGISWVPEPQLPAPTLYDDGLTPQSHYPGTH